MQGCKKFILFIFLFSSVKLVCGQADSSGPVYLRFPTIPQFTIFNVKDSSTFTRDNLKKKKPTIFILFSPECEHCQREIKELEAHIDRFKNAQIIMVTYLAFAEMKKFYSDYHIANYPMITMGRDAKYFFPVYFKLRNMPSIYVYDKKGNFKKAFEGSVNVLKIAEQI